MFVGQIFPWNGLDLQKTIYVMCSLIKYGLGYVRSSCTWGQMNVCVCVYAFAKDRF